METIRCPYCDSKVLMADVEIDDGTCPECGAPLMGSSLFGDEPDADDEFEEEGEDILSLDDDGLDDDDDE
jgi:DNA-directed RNA polymerase subunit RPC12/RpoP